MSKTLLICAALWVCLVPGFASAQQTTSARILITQPINEKELVRLTRNTHPLALAAQDKGAVADDVPVSHLTLLLKRPAERQAAFDQFVDDLHNPGSSSFHQWLTAQSIGSQFGLAPQDISTVTAWLQSHGFTVNVVFPSNNMLDFSGTAGQLRSAFHTEMHRLESNGERHTANLIDPAIPAALAPAIEGITSLNDFHPHHAASGTSPALTFTDGEGQYVGPGDLAVIYNLNPLYAAGVSGKGQTIAVLEDSDLYTLDDWYAYRRVFGLTKAYPYGTITQVQPSSTAYPCRDPGAVYSDREAALDAEVVTAVAPNANVLVAACASTYDGGIFIAMRNLLDSPNTPAVMSISYGQSETVNGSAYNAFIYSLYEQAVAQGVSVFVATGDWGADAVYADRGTASVHGLSVSGFASTPYNVAVGGTDFEDTYLHQVANYWNSTNTGQLESAKSYIPEIPWDGNCADILQANYYGYATSYGTDGFCNSATVPNNLLYGGGGSGGPSSCAFGVPSTLDVVSGTCAGYPKPAWQALVGNPNDGVRDLPDVALFAAGGAWNHAYYICYSDPAREGTSCATGFQTSGGTSASTPLMASIQALVNQSTNARWGNPDWVYYALANQQYGASGSSTCNASLGNGSGSGCIFHDITQGDNDVICNPGSPNCFAPSGTFGVLSLSTTSYVPAYPATVGWDFATGIGSVNAYNLVTNWNLGVAMSQPNK